MHVIARMNVGGPAVLVASTMRGLDPDLFDVRLITGNCAEDEQDYLMTQATDLTAIRLEGLGRSVRPKDDLAAVHRLSRLLRDLQPDVVHTHTAKAGVVGRLATQLSRCRAGTVHTYHGHLLHGYFSPAKTRAVMGVERGLARITDHLVAVAPAVRDDLLAARIGRPGQYEVIAPGVELGPLPGRDSARLALGLPMVGPVITMLGRVTSIKRPDRFADAARAVHAHRPDAVFAVAGSGDLVTDLQFRVRDLPVSLLGWRSDIETVLAASDILVLSSDNEGAPLSLVQAGLAGLPVVATNVGAVSSVVSDGVTGLLVRPSADDLAQGILTLLDNEPLAAQLGAAGRMRMTEQFSIGTMVERHAHLYDRAASAWRPMEE